jgi:hypothetical protein
VIICCIIPAIASAEEIMSSPTITSLEALPGKNAMNEAPVEFNKEYFKGYWTDFKNIVTSPVRWDMSDWITAGAVTGVAVLLYDNDAKIQKWVQEHKSDTTTEVGDNVTDLGHGKYTVALLGGMYIYGHFADDGKMRKTVLLSVESFVLTGLFVQTIKYATHRHRPDTGDGPHAWDGPSLHGTTSNQSFPSGHASSAFAVATVIASEYDNAIVPPLAYTVAGITALNRVFQNGHWASDVFVGSAIGYFTGKAIVASHRGGDTSRLSFAPMTDGRSVGMVVTYKF